MRAPGWARHLAGVDPKAATSRAALARLPLLRKSDLPALQKQTPPFGGLNVLAPNQARRVMVSPGPIFELEGHRLDAAGVARALFAAGVRAGDIVHNAFSYHLTPGGWMLDDGAHALGCTIIPGGVGNTEQQIDVIAHLRASAYVGTPDFLKILLDTAQKSGKDLSCLKRALVSGAALPASLRDELTGRGVAVLQCYAAAETGVIAYETAAGAGLVVNENLLIEIVRPGTGEPVPDGEVGEVVVTTLNPDYPMIRLGTGDLSAVLPGPCPTGRTNTRIKGWLGRADQTAKVRGMFVHPGQIAEVARRHPQVRRARLVVEGAMADDRMTLHVEVDGHPEGLDAQLAESIRDVTKLRGEVVLCPPGGLPNDGKVIDDQRSYD